MLDPGDSNSPRQIEIRRWVFDAAQSGEPDTYTGKRHAKRFAEGMMIEVALDLPSAASIWNATMHNVSQTGLSFWTRHDVDVGKTIYVREFSSDEPHPWVRTRVRHKTRAVQGHLIGLVFEL